MKRITTHGRPIFMGMTGTYWSRGDKVIAIGRSGPAKIRNAFIKPYLTRYPTTLEPAFDLP